MVKFIKKALDKHQQKKDIELRKWCVELACSSRLSYDKSVLDDAKQLYDFITKLTQMAKESVQKKQPLEH